ncbi:membrane-associated guanylate kinase, WW and PDZ domain-containing protein 1-like isoform X2 [Heptranchias perlo]|uniref:membrane-associated guanylate kinase, WW and PDZ domain-containing protein 1-like isoform X2 n=1 Tax=Heptranchias perlo TaxID=212740 RepID=UPI003559B46E
MEIHDVVVAVDKISVLGSTHSEVVRLFQAVAEGDRAELQLHRGYPALYKMEPRQLSETNACAPLPSPAPLALIPVALMQSSNGPGFAVEARGSGGGGYARVQRIWDGHRCPCLAVGDLIVKVNGQRVRVLSDEQLDEVLRTHTRAGDVVLLVQRAVKGPAIGTQVSPDSIRCSADGSARPQAGYTERGDGDGAGQPPRKACQRPHGPEAPWSDGPEQKDSGKPPEAITHQRGDEGSELVALSMDKASPATSIIPWRFSQMTRTSPVDRCETARAGDHTETLNGRQHWVEDADPSLKPRLAPWERNGASCKADAREPVRRSWSRPAELDDPRVSSRAKMRGVHPDQDSELYSVELERSPTGFGFSVRGGREYNMGLYVLGLIVGGPAMRSGKIKIGDQLLEINSELTLGITHSRAVDLIKEGRDKIRLLMRRGDGQVPKYTPDTPGETDRGAAAEHPVRQQQPDPLITPGRTKLQSHSRGTQTRPEPEPEAQARPEPEAQALPHPEPEAQSRVASSPDPALAWKRGQLDVESEGRARGSRPQEATLEGGDTDSRPTTDGSRGCGLSGCRGRDYDWPQALLDPPRPQALPHPRPRPAESSETESDGSWSGASDRGPSSEESSPLGSFDKQRLLNSMVGRLLDGPLAKEAEAGGYCVHCWRRSRRALTPGPWIVPKREKLLEIMDGSWLS